MSSQDTIESEKGAITRPDFDGRSAEGLDDLTLDKQTSRGTLPELKHVCSNALSKVASRLTTRDIIDPGPPPDGGLQAWTQVIMAWGICFVTW